MNIPRTGVRLAAAAALTVATLGVTISPAAATTTAPSPATKANIEATASRIIVGYKASRGSNRPQLVSIGPAGTGTNEWLNAGEWSEWAWVGATRIPRGCKLYANGILTEVTAEHAHWHTWLALRGITSVSLEGAHC